MSFPEGCSVQALWKMIGMCALIYSLSRQAYAHHQKVFGWGICLHERGVWIDLAGSFLAQRSYPVFVGSFGVVA